MANSFLTRFRKVNSPRTDQCGSLKRSINGSCFSSLVMPFSPFRKVQGYRTQLLAKAHDLSPVPNSGVFANGRAESFNALVSKLVGVRHCSCRFSSRFRSAEHTS